MILEMRKRCPCTAWLASVCCQKDWVVVMWRASYGRATMLQEDDDLHNHECLLVNNEDCLPSRFHLEPQHARHLFRVMFRHYSSRSSRPKRNSRRRQISLKRSGVPHPGDPTWSAHCEKTVQYLVQNNRHGIAIMAMER